MTIWILEVSKWKGESFKVCAIMQDVDVAMEIKFEIEMG